MNNLATNNLVPAFTGSSLSSSQGGLPIGTIVQFASVNIPSNWLYCNGGAISRTTYSALFAVIGTAYGNGDGFSTFNIPDTTNYFVRGAGTGGVGSYGGSDTVTLAIGNLPPHSHGLQENTNQYNGGGNTSCLQPSVITGTGNRNTNGAILSPNTTTVVTAAAATPTAVNIVNAYVVIPSIIKFA